MLLSTLQVGDTIRWTKSPEHIDVVVKKEHGKLYVHCQYNVKSPSVLAVFGDLTSHLPSDAYIEIKTIEEW